MHGTLWSETDSNYSRAHGDPSEICCSFVADQVASAKSFHKPNQYTRMAHVHIHVPPPGPPPPHKNNTARIQYAHGMATLHCPCSCPTARLWMIRPRPHRWLRLTNGVVLALAYILPWTMHSPSRTTAPGPGAGERPSARVRRVRAAPAVDERDGVGEATGRWFLVREISAVERHCTHDISSVPHSVGSNSTSPMRNATDCTPH